MKRSRFPLLLLAALGLALFPHPAHGQKPRTENVATVADSMRTLLQQRTGVFTTLHLERVLVRGGFADFYFSPELGDYPWRPGDEVWFASTWRNLAAPLIPGYQAGEIYFGRGRQIGEIVMPEPGKNGRSVSTTLRETSDPATANPVVPLVRGKDRWTQGLEGRHIALWQSHGRYWETREQRWEWQRAATHRTVEDLYTQSYVVPLLMPMLERAGAVVMSPRERDPQPWEVVCDNDLSFREGREGMVRRSGQYEEKGNWKDAGIGFCDAQAVYHEYENPFLMGTARKTPATAADAPESEITWRPDIPEDGDYAVYVSYKTLAGSTTEARYTIHHAGGKTLRRVNQQMENAQAREPANGRGNLGLPGNLPFPERDGRVRETGQPE